jgi:hypothetical protein
MVPKKLLPRAPLASLRRGFFLQPVGPPITKQAMINGNTLQ